MTDISEYQRDLADRRARLSRTLGELKYQTKPATIAEREVTRVKARFAGMVQTTEGELRVERIAAIAVTLAVVIGAAVWRRRR